MASMAPLSPLSFLQCLPLRTRVICLFSRGILPAPSLRSLSLSSTCAATTSLHVSRFPAVTTDVSYSLHEASSNATWRCFPSSTRSSRRFSSASTSSLETSSAEGKDTWQGSDDTCQESTENPTAEEGEGKPGSAVSKEIPVERKTKSYYPKKGQELELHCDSLAFKGMGVCKIVETGYVVFCERALPGERLIGRITKSRRGYAEAFKVVTLSPHDNAVDPPCQHFPACGGCKLQNLAYSAQLEAKEKQVGELMERVGGFGRSGPEGPSGEYMLPIVACEEEYRYRNKMEFSFGTRIWLPFNKDSSKPEGLSVDSNSVDSNSIDSNSIDSNSIDSTSFDSTLIGSKSTDSISIHSTSVDSSSSPPASSRDGKRKVDPNPKQFAVGLHAPRRFDKILPIETCMLQQTEADKVLSLVTAHCIKRQNEIPPYDVVTKEGFLRHLTIRTGRDAETGFQQLSVNITTKEDKPELLKPLVDEIVASHPQVASVVNNINSSLSEGSGGVKENLLFGQRFITERLRGLDFEISANSFFQTNTRQAEVLYSLVEDACDLKNDGSEIILDLFCGTGTIGLSMASKAAHVYGYELVPEAVADAFRNAERNGIQNATFVQGDLNKLQRDFGSQFPRPDVVITDPNRPGMHPKLLQFLASSGTNRIVYVSCNPATCARDIDFLCHGPDAMYRLKTVQAVDMFPQTPHVECIVILEHKTVNNSAV